MSNEIIPNLQLILDTTSGDTGTAVTFTDNELSLNKSGYVSVQVGSGDTIVLEGKLSSDQSGYVILDNGTFTSSAIKRIDLLPILRARRSVDGVSADSKVWIKKLGTINGN